MKLFLNRYLYCSSGVCGYLTENSIDVLFYTLEHAYQTGSVYSAKIPNGTYPCIRGMHYLTGMTQAIDTFEIMGVPGHSGLLFHPGNFNSDSAGCILVGDRIINLAGNRVLTHSRESFGHFMELMKGINQFELEIK